MSPKNRSIIGFATAALACLLLAPAAQAAPPTITQTAVTHVTTTSATLQATIAPEAKDTLYHFEYGPEDCAIGPCTLAPEPDGEIKATDPPTTVAVTIEGLTPATTYHFRAFAKNGKALADRTTGPDRTLTTRPLPVPFAPCPNDVFRTDKPSAILPDCRAYEQASPVEKNGLDALGRLAYLKASPNGDRIGFVSTNGLPGGEGAQDLPTYLASRGTENWSTQGMLPPASLGGAARVLGWTPDFSHLFGFAGDFVGGPGGTLVDRDTATGSLNTIVPRGSGLFGITEQHLAYAGSSADGSLVFFESTNKLLPDALEGKSNLYVWDRGNGQLHLAGAMGDGSPPPDGAFAGPYDWMLNETRPHTETGGASANYYTQDLHAISEDGSVYFTAAKSGQLYLRTDPAGPAPTTTHVSASTRPEPDPLGSRPAAFMGATPDGSRAFFTSPEELTNEANTGPPQPPPSIGAADLSSEPPTIEAGIPSIAAGAIATDSTYLYWVNTAAGTIGRVELNGDNPEPDFITVPPLSVCPTEKTCPPEELEQVEARPNYIAVDGEHIYWTNDGKGENEEGTIARADIDGTPESIAASIEMKWIPGASRPQGIAVDSSHVYWANAGKDEPTRGIGRADIGGGGANQSFIPSYSTERPLGVATDANFIYWTFTDNSTVGTFSGIRRRNLSDGSVPSGGQYVGINYNTDLRGIAVDPGHLYWASQGDEAIGRLGLADFGKGNCGELPSCEREFIPLQGRPKGLALQGDQLRWSLNGEAVPNPGNDLYLFQHETGQLSDLTLDATDPNGAEVKGVLGISEDGKRLYLAANGDLDAGGPAQKGNCRGSGASGSGQCGLYLFEEAVPGQWTPRFIATLDTSGSSRASDALNWTLHGGTADAAYRFEKSALVSAEGSILVFRSQRQLTDYDNEGIPQFYRYDAGTNQITCLTCNPSGEAPLGEGAAAPHLGSINLDFLVPIDPAFTLSRSVSADGDRFFFESSDALVGADTNGLEGCPSVVGSSTNVQSTCQDVYEWEAQGTGSCEEDLQGGGCLYLLTTGQSHDPSYFADASTDGDTAFLITRPQLVPQEQDGLYDVYAVRVNGGLQAQNQPPPPPPCEEEGCKGPATEPPRPPSPATTAFTGAPDPKPSRCSARKVRKRGKCVKKKAGRTPHHKRHGGKQHNNNRTTGR